MLEADWQAVETDKTPGTVTIGITTFNQPEFCVDQLRLLAEHPDALSMLHEILLVDQGTQKVEDAEGFAEVAAPLGGKLRDHQPGEPRRLRRLLPAAMFEAVENGERLRPADGRRHRGRAGEHHPPAHVR